MPSLDFEPIENHAIIGDLHTIALVALNGAIDFLCYPRFDSPSVFGALLDQERGGFFQISAELPEVRRKQLYLPNSNIVLTRFLSGEGVIEISDFMDVNEEHHPPRLIRRVKAVRGSARITMHCAPRFDYARATHRCEIEQNGIVFISEGKDGTRLRLTSSLPLQQSDGDATASCTLQTDESAYFVLTDAGDSSIENLHEFVSFHFKRTLNFWHTWISRCQYQGRWREMVFRSALTLKLLVSRPYGSLIAAPTFGLPEVLGGPRNWDYRYTWIRDASFTVYGLMRLGYTEEAGAFVKWIEARCGELNEDGSLQIMYRIDGEHEIPEHSLESLRGYHDSRPVRIGNGAFRQVQLDIHGELMDSVYIYDREGGTISHDFWKNLVRLIDWVSRHWEAADAGIWEVRGGPQHFLYSRLMCWVALDRGVRLARKRSLPAPIAEWEKIRDEIYADIFAHFWDDEKKAFVQSRGSKAIDASCLLMPLVKFIAPNDPRWLSTLDAVRRELSSDSLIHRYCLESGTPDGFSGTEGTFSMCTFWFAECLARGGDVQLGRFVFEKMLGYANHVGLYAEQLGADGQHLGNFPQAFTHLGLISAAYAIDRCLNAK